jgi:hypothetical protein
MCLAYGGRQIDAAALAGVSDRTIRRWIERDPGFAALVEGYAARALFELGVGLTRLQSIVLEELEKLLRTGTDTVKLGAIRTALAENRYTREELHFKRETALITDLAVAIERKLGEQ